MMTRPDRALSETFSVVIIALLVLAASILLLASLSGVITNMLQKPALFSVQAIQYNASSSTRFIGLFHQQGDPVNLNGTPHTKGISIVSFTITDTAGTHPISPGPVTGDAWSPGEIIYIYTSGGGTYRFSDSLPPASVGLSPGTYSVQVIDDKAHILLHTLPVTIG